MLMQINYLQTSTNNSSFESTRQISLDSSDPQTVTHDDVKIDGIKFTSTTLFTSMHITSIISDFDIKYWYSRWKILLKLSVSQIQIGRKVFWKFECHETWTAWIRVGKKSHLIVLMLGRWSMKNSIIKWLKQ